MAIDITIGGFHLFIHQSIVNWLLLCVILCVFFILAGKKIKKADPRQKDSYWYAKVLPILESVLSVIT